MAVYPRKCRSPKCSTMVYDLDWEDAPLDGKRHRAPITVAKDEGDGFLTPDGKRVRGNIVINLADGTYRVVSKSRLAVVGHEGLHLNHFGDCPAAKQWSRTGVASWTGAE